MTETKVHRADLPQPAPLATRFITDAMLGSLARKLRVFGFDTSYFRRGEDSDLLALAKREGRVLLTSDRSLAASSSKRGVLSLLIQGRTEKSRLRSLVEESRKVSLDLTPGDTRCPSCNAGLGLLPRSEVLGEVPEKVVARHRVYYRCPECGKLYWKGTQWKRLRRLSTVLRARV